MAAQQQQHHEHDDTPTPATTTTTATATATPANNNDERQLSNAVLAALQGVVPKADVYLLKAAQASTYVFLCVCRVCLCLLLNPLALTNNTTLCTHKNSLRQLKTARKLLRDFNAAAKHELEQQIAAGEVAVKHLLAIREDLDATYACIRSVFGVVCKTECVLKAADLLLLCT